MRRACRPAHCPATLEPPLQAFDVSEAHLSAPAAFPSGNSYPNPPAKVPGRIVCQVSLRQVDRPGAARWQGSPHPPRLPRVQPPCLKMEQGLGAWGRALGSHGQAGAELTPAVGCTWPFRERVHVGARSTRGQLHHFLGAGDRELVPQGSGPRYKARGKALGRERPRGPGGGGGSLRQEVKGLRPAGAQGGAADGFRAVPGCSGPLRTRSLEAGAEDGGGGP